MEDYDPNVAGIVPKNRASHACTGDGKDKSRIDGLLGHCPDVGTNETHFDVCSGKGSGLRERPNEAEEIVSVG